MTNRPITPALQPLPRRGLNREQAAVYIGLSPTKFDELVRTGLMPRPKRVGSRRIWDVRRLDIAFDALQDDAADKSGAWNDF